ncbi:MAG: carboxypeptidase regulatory-like domain-containing protein [Cyanobacteriota bacterium]|nr:carboxypeptidase regulatory-like domain-containing protein [Cyanobacteriota bacterium]
MKLILPLALLAILGFSAKGWAHGTAISYKIEQAIAIEATYDSGKPMANAQVLIYAPDNPSQVWQKGTTDERGKFVFIPDRARSGNWEVAVRQAGHGEIAVIPIPPETATVPPDSETAEPQPVSISEEPETLTPLQKGTLVGSTIWGFVGTALFFMRGKK